MADGRKPIPAVHGAAIEAFTGGAVTRKHLFPNDWARIWPELAAYEAAGTVPTNTSTSTPA